MNLKFYLFLCVFACTGLTVSLQAQDCDANTMITTGVDTVFCALGDGFDVATDGNQMVPDGGGFGWFFSNSPGGTGALGGEFILSSAPDTVTYDADLNGILSNNNFPLFDGAWSVRAAVYADAGDTFGSICSLSSDSLIVIFLNGGPVIDDITVDGSNAATVVVSGGMMPYTFEWSDGQTTQTTTPLPEGIYGVTVTDADGCQAVDEVIIGNPPTCLVGALTTTGSTTLCGDNATFDIATDGSEVIPSSGGFGWVFSNVLGGTGALGGDFILTGAGNPATYDADLNGILSGANFPPFDGTWVVKGAVYDNSADAFNSICDLTADSLIVNFGGDVMVMIMDNGDGSATASASGGTPPYTYTWSDGQEGETASGLADGNYQVTVTDSFGCEETASISIGNEPGACLDWINPDPGVGWTDFNTTFGGAPSQDLGCPFNEIDAFQVWASEAYNVENFVEGVTYTFSMCNGPGAGSWVPEFTIIAPSGAVDAFGAGDGDGCSITWTASESGTYLIVINEAGLCGTSDNTSTDNGFPALTCEGGEVPPCSIGQLTTTGQDVICNDDDTFELATDGTDTIPGPGGFGWIFSSASGGTGGPGGDFTLLNADNPVTYDTDLNGIVSGNSDFDPLTGIWVVYGTVYLNSNDVEGSTCGVTSDSLVLIFVEDELQTLIQDNEDGTATALVADGTPPYTFEWSDGQTTETAVDLDGGTYSVTVTDALGCTATATGDVMSSVGEIEGLQSLFLSPNPTTGILNLRLELDSPEMLRLEVRNATGQVIEQTNFGSRSALSHEFNWSNLSSGIYFVRLIGDSGELTKRVMLSK